MRFSVVIPTYHRNDLLAKCLDCLAPNVQTLAAEQYEVIVSDDGHESTAEDMIRQSYPWVKWVAGLRKGPAANRNIGAKYARGEWLVFTDDDCLPDLWWLEAYDIAIVKDESCFVFEGRTYIDRERHSFAETSPINETGGYLWSCNLCMSKQVFDQIGGFDERYYAAMEDVDLRTRIKNSKYSFSFVKLGSVCHPWRHRKIKGDGWKSFRGYKDALLTYLSIHPDEGERINSHYFLFSAFRSLIRVMLPNLFKYKFRGIKELFYYDILFNLYMCYICFAVRRKTNAL